MLSSILKWFGDLGCRLNNEKTRSELSYELSTLRSEIRETKGWIGSEFPEVRIVCAYMETSSGSYRQSYVREELRSLKRSGLLTPTSAAVEKTVARYERLGSNYTRI